MQYFFILGKNPDLSLAEIVSVLGVDSKVIYSNSEVAIFNIPQKQDASELMSRLGGTIKIGEVVKEDSLNNIQVEDLVGIIESNSKDDKKVYFGFSLYGQNSQLKKNLKFWPMEIKKVLKNKNLVCRWVTSRDNNLSSVIVKKNHLLDQGAEIVFILDGNKAYLGRTQVVQEFEEFSLRDYGREFRDIKSGMLPPKLARMMINLSQIKEAQVLLDPFCGSGTILQEALLLGYKVIGSDVNEKAVEDSRRNLEWLKENSKLRALNSELFQINVKNISKKVKQVDAIVTEPYLGPPLRGKPKEDEVKKIVDELSNLYLEAFREFKRILKPNGKIVIIFPAFKLSQNKIIHLSIVSEVENLGFKKINSLIYSRPDQKVLREVFIWES